MPQRGRTRPSPRRGPRAAEAAGRGNQPGELYSPSSRGTSKEDNPCPPRPRPGLANSKPLLTAAPGPRVGAGPGTGPGSAAAPTAGGWLAAAGERRDAPRKRKHRLAPPRRYSPCGAPGRGRAGSGAGGGWRLLRETGPATGPAPPPDVAGAHWLRAAP